MYTKLFKVSAAFWMRRILLLLFFFLFNPLGTCTTQGDSPETPAAPISVTEAGISSDDSSNKAVRVAPQATSVSQVHIRDNYLVWLDTLAKSVYRIKRPIQSALMASQPPFDGADAEKLWSGEPLQEPAGLTLDNSGTIYIVDKKAAAIFSLSPGNELKEVYSGHLLQQPTSIAFGNGMLYVIDSGTQKLLSFNLAQKKIIEEYKYDADLVPDRLSYDNGNLITFNTRAEILDRFVTTADKATTTAPPPTAWELAEGERYVTLPRGQRLQLKKALGTISDFAVANNIAYFLDVEQLRLVLLPLDGGEPTSVPYNGLAQNPTAIAANDEELYLIDGHQRRFNRSQVILPVQINFEGDWTPLDLINFYEYLYDKKLLTTKLIKIESQVTLETLVMNQNTLPTGYLKEFQDLFCRMNTAICNKWEKNTRPSQLAQDSSTDKFVIDAGSEVVLPDIKVLPYPAQREVSFPLKLTLYRAPIFRKYINGPLGALALEFAPKDIKPEELEQELLKLNRSYKGNNILTETVGDFYIPIQGARLKAAVPKIDVMNSQSRLSEIVKQANVTATSPSIKSEPKAALEVGRLHLSQPDSLLLTMLPETGDLCEAVDVNVKSNAMSLVNYCYPTALIEGRVPDIAIIDNNFNDKHPVFTNGQSSNLTIYKDPDATVESEPLPDVKRPDGPTSFMDIDHGTHIAALIGAQKQPDEMVGFFPKAQLYGIRVEEQMDIVIDNWRFLRLFNVSLGERTSTAAVAPNDLFVETRPLMKFIRQYSYALFVVSAGNDAQEIKDETLASLGYLDNVLVVGATNSPVPLPGTNEQPQLTLMRKPNGFGSNYHKDLMGLVAPGEKIKSALYNGQYGTADGTSQSTAFVTGAAAILMTVEPSWKVWQVKFRLVATSDLWTDSALNQAVFAGMLNLRRAALDTKVTVINHQTNGMCKGQIVSTDLDKEIRIRMPNGSSPLRIKLRNILRFKRYPLEPTKFTIIYYDSHKLENGAGRKNFDLKREVAVETFNMMGDYTFNFNVTQPTANCKSDKVNLKTLLDFTNTFYPAPDEDH